MFTGRFVQLEPLVEAHAEEVAAAVGADRQSYAWALVPNGVDDAVEMIRARLALRDAGAWLPFVQRRIADGALVGMTNILAIERWNGPENDPTSIEIGGTWLHPSAQRTPINTEAKYLLMSQAFDVWGVFRVQIKTDERNAKSRAAIERLGATFEGVLRSYQPGQGERGAGQPRNTAMYSVLQDEWPTIKAGLESFIAR
jgi:N-acetyltransferase